MFLFLTDRDRRFLRWKEAVKKSMGWANSDINNGGS